MHIVGQRPFRSRLIDCWPFACSQGPYHSRVQRQQCAGFAGIFLTVVADGGGGVAGGEGLEWTRVL